MVTPAYLPQVGGLENVIQDLALALLKLGHQVAIAHLTIFQDEPTQETINGLPVYRLPLKGTRLVGWANGLRALASQYDLLHVHDPQLMAITANVRFQCAAVPAVLSTHGGFNHTNRFRLAKNLYRGLLLKKVLAHYRQVLASSQSDFEYFRPCSSHTVLCSNGVNIEHFSADAHKPVQPHRWIYWGRLASHKRLDLVLDYLVRLRAKGIPATLTICGWDFDGTEANLMRTVFDRGLQTAVRILGVLTVKQLRHEVGAHGLFISASEHEGFGLSLVEAMAAGLLVVCRDKPPMTELIADHETGLTLSFDKSDQDVDRLCHFLNTPLETLARYSREAQTKAQQYGWNHAAIGFVGAYDQAIASNRFQD